MPKFISISLFKSLYLSQSDLLLEDGLNNFVEKLNSSEGDMIFQNHGVELAEKEAFIRSLKEPTTVLFHGWLAQSPELEKLMHGSNSFGNYIDTHNHLQHKMAEKYRQFLSPYLSNRLLKYAGEEKHTEIARYFTFVQLLDEDHTAVVEEALFKPIQKALSHIKSSDVQINTEQELIELVQPLCSNDVMSCVNSISKTSYALKLDYVDGILGALERRTCTPRFANWVIKQLDSVKLNEEHNYKLRNIRKGIKGGAVKFNDSKGSNFRLNWKMIALPVLILLVFFGVQWYVDYTLTHPDEIDHSQLAENTSFQKFSVEERKKIDSILREMDDGRIDEQDLIDQGIPLFGGASATLTLREEFDNIKMESIYQDLDKDASLQAGGNNSNCDTKIDFIRRTGVKDLANKRGDVEIMMRNESEFDVVVYVFDNRSSGEVHSMHVKMGETHVYKMNEYDGLLVVPGNNFQGYEPPIGIAPVDLPSKNYTHHFCETDVTYGEAINTPYQLIDVNAGTAKFMLAGYKWSYFEIVDLYGALEPM